MTTVAVTNHSTTVTVTESAVVVTPSETTTDVTVINGVDTFLALSDTPNAYASQGGKAVAVKGDATGLEFVAFPAGVSDHGALTGLGDDDHPQYHTDARGDLRYWPLSTDLATQAELDAAFVAHLAAADPHPGYLTPAEGNALYWPLSTDLVTQAEGDAAYARLAAANTFTLGPNTFRAGGAGNVPLVVQLAASPTADALRILASDGTTKLSYFDKQGRLSVGSVGTVAGIRSTLFAAGKTITDVFEDGGSSRLYSGVYSAVTLNHTSGSGTLNASLYGVRGFSLVAGGRPPSSLYGLSFFAENDSSDVSGMTRALGAALSAYQGGGNTIAALVGLEVDIDNYGSGGVTSGIGIHVYSNNPDAGSMATSYGMLIDSQAGSGTTAYALRTDGGENRHLAGGATVVPMALQRAASQSADMLRLLDSDGSTILHRYNKAGYWVTKCISAPADADLSAGECALWFDPTNGAAKLMIKAKETGGTVRTGSVPLT